MAFGASMTTKKHLWLGFGVLTGLLVVSVGLILLRARNIEHQVDAMANTARARSAMTREIELNLLDYALGVRAFTQTDDPRFRQDAEGAAAEVERYLIEYQRLVTTPRERELAARMPVLWRDVKESGQDLLNSRARPSAREPLVRLGERRIAMEAFLDDEVQVNALESYEAIKASALRDTRGIVGVAWVLLVAGAGLAIVISTVIGRAVVRTEREVRAGREGLRITLASIGDGVITTDTQARVTFINAVAESLTGWEQSDAAGKPLLDIFRIVNETTREAVANPVLLALSQGTIVGLANHTILIARDGAERPISDSAAPIKDEQGRVEGAVLVFRDDSARRRMESILLDADRRKDEFLATLAHELRNPLAPLRFAADLLRRSGTDAAAVSRVTGMIDRQVVHMVHLIDDLLDVNRIAQGKIELRQARVDLASVVVPVIEANRPLLESAGIGLSVTLPPTPLHVNADATRVAQVIGNLLNNAGKFTPRGGDVWLTVERADGQAVVRVRDNGLGIAPADFSRVFEMFVQLDRALDSTHGGLGLGLTLAKRFTELHGGTIDVHSPGAGQGTEFTVRLPILIEPPLSEASSQPMAIGPAVTVRRRILVVDDNQDSAEMLTTLLTIQGHEVRMVHDGVAAVELAATFRPEMIVLDIGLPKLNGYEAAQQIRKLPFGEQFRLVALTGWGQDLDRRRSAEAGFDVHLVKPVDPEVLCTLIADLPSTTGEPLGERPTVPLGNW